MMPVLLVACASLAATGAVSAQTDAKPDVKLPAESGAKPAIDVPKIAYTKFVLPNGLTVVLHEDHSSPIAALELDFHVGSRDEPVGKRGFAHLREHMMYEAGPQDHARIIQEAGGSTGAFTKEGRTWYTDKVPANMLETVLWLEAERLAFLPARLDSVHFERAREAVLNEYAQNVTNAPAGGYLGSEAFLTGLFPDPSPYHVSQFGVMSELSAASIQDVRGFFDKYYTPNNATLVIAGDFKTAGARKMVEKYFNGIPRHPDLPHPAVPQTPLTKETRFVLEDRVANTQQLWVGWRGAPTRSAERVPLTALAAILSNGPTSRLYKALVGDRKMTVSLLGSSGHYDLEDAGIFQLSVAASGNASLTDVEHVVDSVVAAVRDGGIQPEELRRWLASYTVSSITGLQSVSQKAGKLADDEVFLHDPGALSKDLAAARRLTPADLQRVARKYLVPGRVVMSIVPAGKLNLASKPSETYVNVTKKP
jgi:zinc protease